MATRSTPTVALFVLTLVAGTEAMAQEGTWSFSAAAGIAFLQFGQVDADGRNDVEFFRELHATPISYYPALSEAPVISFAASYRFERDMSVSLMFGYERARTTTSFQDTIHSLSLDRRLTGTVLGTDIAYYFQPFIGGVEISLFAGLGVLWGSADQVTKSDSAFKVGPIYEWRKTRDDYSLYKKSKLIVRAGVNATVPIFGATSFLAGIAYQHAPLGSMSGTLREYVPADGSFLVRPHETAIEFDYSTLQLTLGILTSF